VVDAKTHVAQSLSSSVTSSGELSLTRDRLDLDGTFPSLPCPAFSVSAFFQRLPLTGLSIKHSPEKHSAETPVYLFRRGNSIVVLTQKWNFT
jgi:hypothetical protein